jgi:hypothetical protein
MVREEGQSEHDGQDGQRRRAPTRAPRQFFAVNRDPIAPKNSQRDKECGERQFDKIDCGKANGIMRGQ